MRGSFVIALVLATLVLVGPASAQSWLPHPDNATWTYQWSDSAYSPTPTKEKVTVANNKGGAFDLDWSTDNLDNPTDAVSSHGTVSLQETDSGLTVTNWSSDAPPPAFPVLCSSVSQCGNSLVSTWYQVIWGNRVPMLAEPIVKGLSWTATGGTGNDVTSSSEYLGVEKVTVPAFSQPVLAAKIQTNITQAGAVGDPYGSGVRTVWWVYGVGPVKVVFDHTGGSNAPVTTSELVDTNQTPGPPPPDADYFPLVKNKSFTYRWTNTKWLKQPEVEQFTVAAVSNGSAQITAQSISGPIKAKGAYIYTSRVSGLIDIAATTSAATTAVMPKLGPESQPPDKRRHFFTPYDLMDFGFNPILPAYAVPGTTWSSQRGSTDFANFGVTGTSKVVGIQTVKVPAGTFQAVEVVSTLKQPGFPAGSGTRTSWFAPGKGLVKLLFRHEDGSVSDIELLK
jgi:hypothetical protein